MPIAKRPCANCPFRSDGNGVELQPGRLEEIVTGLLSDDSATFICHKTLDSDRTRKTCAGALAVMSKLDRLPVIGRLALITGVIKQSDIEASAALVIDPSDLNLPGEDKGVRKVPPTRLKTTI